MRDLARLAAALPFPLDDTEAAAAAFAAARSGDAGARRDADLWAYIWTLRYVARKFLTERVGEPSDVDAVETRALEGIQKAWDRVEDAARFPSYVSVVCKNAVLTHRARRRTMVEADEETLEPNLFSDTVGHNVAFGAPDATEADIRQASDEADLTANVEDFPQGFDTVVGERGVTLSGGQKQRTAIARALIRRPRVLLFDDALSAVDTRTEATILAHLRRQFGQRTVVIVSHRVSAVQDADQIVVLDDGRVAEHGSHDDLVALGGTYATMVRKQLLEAELAEA